MSESTQISQGLKASWWLAAVALLSGIGGGVVFPILPMLGQQLGLAAFMVGLILAANRITRIFFNPLTGSLVDRFGARWPVAIGLFVEALAVLGLSAGITSSHHAGWFLCGRVLWGVGSSLMLVGTLAAAMAVSSHSNRGRLTGRVRTAITLGIPAGMLLGGVIADLASPTAAFLSAAAITVGTGLLALWVLPRRSRSESSDTHKATKQETPSKPRRAWSTLLRNPMLQVVWCSNALVFFAVSGVVLSTLVVWVHARQITILGLDSAGTAGILMAVMMTFRAAAALGMGSVLDRSSKRTAALVPAAVVTAVGFGVLVWAHAFWSLGLSLAVIGLGTGALTIPLLTLLSDTAPAHSQGRATGIYQIYGDIGGSLGPIAGLQLGSVVGYVPIYIALAAAMLLVTVPLYWLVRRERAENSEDA